MGTGALERVVEGTERALEWRGRRMARERGKRPQEDVAGSVVPGGSASLASSPAHAVASTVTRTSTMVGPRMGIVAPRTSTNNVEDPRTKTPRVHRDAEKPSSVVDAALVTVERNDWRNSSWNHRRYRAVPCAPSFRRLEGLGQHQEDQDEDDRDTDERREPSVRARADPGDSIL